MNRNLAFSLILAASIVASGCQQIQDGAERIGLSKPSVDTSNPQAASLTKALAAGGLSAGVIKAAGGKDPEKWAIGIAVGTWAIDQVITTEVQKRRAKYKAESEYLDAEIASTQQSVATKKSQLQRVQDEMKGHVQTAALLETSAKENRLSKATLQKSLTDLDATIATVKAELEIAAAEVEIATEAVNTSKSIKDPTVSEAELDRRRAELLAKRDERLAQYKLFLGTQEQAEALRERVASLQ